MSVLLINSPTRGQPIVRDMAGGLGFDGGATMVLPPLELCYMASTLLKKGIEVEIIDSDVEGYNKDSIFHRIKNQKPETILATISLPTLNADSLFIKEIRDYAPGTQIIALTDIIYPAILKEILERSCADLCIYGECDLIIDKIISGEETNGTASLKDGKLIINKNSMVENLDELPLPARQLLSNAKYQYTLLGKKTTTMQTSRGCPFSCGYYCPYPLVQGKGWRFRTPEHVLREIEDIIQNYHINKILFRDAVFTLNKERAHQICDLIIQNKLEIKWWCETRIDCLDVELLKKMKDAGCLGMNVGVETGDPEVMKTQAKRGLTIEKLQHIQGAAQKFNIKLHFLLSLGFPDETKESIYKTYKLICSLRPDSIGICIITPYPGTPLYSEAKQKNWIETEDWTRFGGHSPVMHTDNLSIQDLQEAYDLLLQGFRRLKSPMRRMGTWLFDRKFQRWVKS